MPENRQVQSNGVSGTSNASAENIEDAMRRLKIQTQDLQDGVSAQSSPYPDRPGEPDCIYYLRTGMCGYGSNCRFNHPPYSGQAAQYRGELPERTGEPNCQYFLKTGTCRFGATCKYNHPRDRLTAGQVPLNIWGLPMRQEEKPCPFYMRNWSCKFGVACKFHHPQPLGAAVLPVTGSAAYGTTSSSGAPPSGLAYAGGLPAWSLPRSPYLPGARMQGPQAYMPVVLSPSQGIMHTQQGWNTYTGTMNQVSSTGVLGPNILYNSNKNQGELGSAGQVPLLPTTVYPERPDQPECQYYIKTGSCKFGPTCKYHHPKERNPSVAAATLNPCGLPQRPGQAVCTFYSTYGICKFGSTCKFDHPLQGFYNYGVSVNVPTLTMPEPPYPYQKNSTISHSSETSPSKSSRLPDGPGKSETTSPKHQSVDIKEPVDSSQQEHSPKQASSAFIEPPHDPSD